MKSLGYFVCCGLLLIGAGTDAANTQPKEKLYRLPELLLMPGTTPKDGLEWSTSLGDYQERNLPVYFGACLETRFDHDLHGRPIPGSATYFKHMIFFPPHASEGTYTVGATGRDGNPTVLLRATDMNGGRISIKPQAEIYVTGQGGPAEWAVFKINTEYLLRKRLLKLVQPRDFVAAVNAPVKTACPKMDDYETSRTDGMERFYKARGWDTPTPLPGR